MTIGGVFKDYTTRDLGYGRILFFAFILVTHFGRDYRVWGGADTIFLKNRQPLYEFFNIYPVSSPVMEVIFWAWIASLILSMLGLFTRTSQFVAIMTSGYLWGLRYGMDVSHTDAIVLCTMILVWFSPSGNRVSLDQYLFKHKDDAEPLDLKWFYYSTTALFAFIFFHAGLLKLKWMGLEWMRHDYLFEWFNLEQYIISWNEGSRYITFGYNLLGRIPLVGEGIAISSLIIELASPLALLNRFNFRLIIFLLAGLQVGIHVVYSWTFWTYVPIYLILINWDTLVSKKLGNQ